MSERALVEAPANQPLTGAGTLLDDAMAVAFDVHSAVERLDRLKAFFRAVMVEGQGKDYGPPFPGSTAKQLYSSGADKLSSFFGVYDRPRCTHRLEQWGLVPGERAFLHFEFESDLISYRTGQIVSVGVGSCNSMESKYRYRREERKCPTCQQPAILQSMYADRDTGQKGWYCNQKKGGCNAKFAPDDTAITSQKVGRVENTEVQELHHTILRIATKRAKVHGVTKIASAIGLLMEVGAEDDDDDRDDHDRDDQRGGTGRPDPKPDATPAGETKTSDLIGEPERAMLFRACVEGGRQWPAFVQWVQEEHRVDLRKQPVPRVLYQALLSRLQGLQEAKTQDTKKGAAF